VGGVSQECTDSEFREFFEQFGRVLDATLMMDKETGRPRGFGFVTFDSDAAVDRTLAQDLHIHDKYIEVKRAEPRGNVRDGDGGGHGKFGRQNRGQNFNNENQQNQNSQNQQGNTMSMAQAATYWQMMQNMFKQSQMMANANGGGMNPMAAMQMQQQMMAARGMNPAMMQQMGNMQGNMGNMQAGNIQGGGYPGMQSPGSGSPMNGGVAPHPPFNAQEQLLFEQQKYERQQNVRMQSGSFQGSNTWDGMYDDVPPPAGIQSNNNTRGGYNNRGGRGGRAGSQGATPQPAVQAPANAPTGPRNANVPGANYRGGGRGGRRGYHPYARGGA
jgi:RNA-binding protein Musashi